ncbi:MAG: hypothetical protein ACTSVY_16350 [Candidatus Helarchaeota archaeon]
MQENEIILEFRSWKKLHHYLTLERTGYFFSEPEIQEIIKLLDCLLLKRGKKIESCIKKHGLEHVLLNKCSKIKS